MRNISMLFLCRYFRQKHVPPVSVKPKNNLDLLFLPKQQESFPNNLNAFNSRMPVIKPKGNWNMPIIKPDPSIKYTMPIIGLLPKTNQQTGVQKVQP